MTKTAVYHYIYTPPSTVLPMPSLRTARENVAHYLLSMYSRVHCHTIVQIIFVNAQVTVNTCTSTDLFTVITTKDQSDGVYNSLQDRWPGTYGCL